MEMPWISQYEKGVETQINPDDYNSIGEILERSVKRFAHKPAFHCMGKTLTFTEIDILSREFASFLQNQLKLKKGSRIALMMPNILQYPIALFGALRSGMVIVNVNPLYTQRELEHQLNDSGAETIVIFENSAHLLDDIIKDTSIKNVVVTGIGDLLGFPKAQVVNFAIKYVKKMVPAWSLKNSYSFKEVLAFGDDAKFIKPEIKNTDIAFLQYTGGTTGVAKGAVLTHRNILANFMQAKTWLTNSIEDGREIIITPLPLYHIFSLTANCLIFSAIGALNILITNPRDMKGFIKELNKWDFTALTGVNTLFNGLLNQEEFKNVDFSHLKLTLGGGMAVQRSVAEEWQKVTQVPLIEAYGLTETSPAACINPMNLREYNGKIGLPIPSTMVEVRDDAGKSLGVGENGEICISGPQVMKGYWNRPEETSNVLMEDGYLRTGDIGYMDEKGFFQIVDRKKDMILVSGFNVYPNEIEDVLSKHKEVLECAAIGVPDEKSGEAVKVFIVPKSKKLTTEEVKEYCREHLTGYKRPRYIEFRSDLPKSNVGKILRKDLRAESSK